MEKQVMVKKNTGNSFGIDIPVLLIFFNRDEQFKMVFEEVKKARPSKLYLYQDGARENRKTDLSGIKKCRDIAEDINWDCEVHTWYQKKNVGCDPSEYLAQKWMFSQEEMGIVLEDDDVPSQSFFLFCKELLEKYKDDERINMICGANNCEVLKNAKTSYVFTRRGHCTGWASWKRVVDLWDSEYKWLDNDYYLSNLRSQMDTDDEYNNTVNACKKHKSSGREHYETIGGIDLYLYNRVNIVPTKNMISNVGYGVEGTHSTTDIRTLPKRIQKWSNVRRYEIEFPLIHPQYVIPDIEFEKGITFTKKQQFFNKWEGRFRQLRYQGFRHVLKKIKRKINRK